MYQVIARKYRPQTFADVVNQDHVKQTLSNALTQGRVGHGYIFSGQRGTGKTTMARILAKCLNCDKGPTAEPCLTCSSCTEIARGNSMDLTEIDAASNRRIDDIRELRENVRYRPVRDRYKVFIIDEAHQITSDAFNALLKTLEEPPPHVVMVLATTEAQKVPATIISRCQRFDFRRIPNDLVVAKLRTLCDAESITAEPAVLDLIARVVWGGLRDAENLLEQLAVSYGSRVTLAQARELLGLGDTETSVQLATAVLKGDASAALSVINGESGRGTDLASVRSGVIDALRAALLLKAGVHDSVSHPPEVVSAMQDVIRGVSMERLLHALAVFGQADIKTEPNSPLPLELAVIEAVTAPPGAGAGAASSGRTAAQPRQETATPRPATTRAPSQGRARGAYRPDAAPVEPPAARYAPASNDPPVAPAPPRRELTLPEKNWETVCRSLNRTKGKRFVLGPLLKASQSQTVVGDSLAVRYTSKANGERLEEEISDAHSRRAVETAVAEAFGVTLNVKVVYEAPSPSGASQPTAMDSKLVRAAVTMGARVIEDRPLDTETR